MTFDNPDIQKAHLEYVEFIGNKEHLGYNAEGYWMASRGLLEQWLQECTVIYLSTKKTGEHLP